MFPEISTRLSDTPESRSDHKKGGRLAAHSLQTIVISDWRLAMNCGTVRKAQLPELEPPALAMTRAKAHWLVGQKARRCAARAVRDQSRRDRDPVAAYRLVRLVPNDPAWGDWREHLRGRTGDGFHPWAAVC
jgi:hypothetical protein